MEKLALKIVEHAFKDKVDLAGKPYIEHLKRVRRNLEGKNQDIRTIALLHDLLEDCPEWSEKVLSCFFYEEIVKSVVALTRVDTETYIDYIKRVSEDDCATIVKIADLEDNMDITRLSEITDKDVVRLKKYLKAHQFLTKQSDKQ